MQLFLVDEVSGCVLLSWGLNRSHPLRLQVHILNESRGSTLEVCISRMKTRGTSVRFVLLSATAPNIEDIAAWVQNSRGNDDAKVFKVRHGRLYPTTELRLNTFVVVRRRVPTMQDHSSHLRLSSEATELLAILANSGLQGLRFASETR